MLDVKSIHSLSERMQEEATVEHSSLANVTDEGVSLLGEIHRNLLRHFAALDQRL